MAACISRALAGVLLSGMAMAQTELPTVPARQSDAGVLDTTLVFQYSTVEIAGLGDGAFVTRAYDGLVPGPTLRFKRGETVRVTLTSNMAAYGTVTSTVNYTTQHNHNDHTDPETTNFHTHGLHVSSQSPQDNVLMMVQPGESHTYEYTIPADHAPGIHWYHPHHHGSTALQVGGGASGMMLIEDEPGSIPDIYLNMETRQVIIQEFSPDVPQWETPPGDTTPGSQGQIDWTNFPTATTFLTNGVVSPQLTMEVNKWYRLQMVNAGVETDWNWGIEESSGCEMYLLAKDGIYLRDAPRAWTSTDDAVKNVHFAPGSRVDVAIMCSIVGQVFMAEVGGGDAPPPPPPPGGRGKSHSGHQKQVATSPLTFNVVDNDLGLTADDLTLYPLNFKYPFYLYDLTTVTDPNTVTANNFAGFEGGAEGAPCTVWHEGVDNRAFDHNLGPNAYIELGTVVEFDLSGVDRHPFHIHVSPVQIQDVVADVNSYHQTGDWLDVLFSTTDTVKVRLQPEQWTGEYVVHCHILDHEDQGCMGFIRVTGSEGTPTMYPIDKTTTTFVDDINDYQSVTGGTGTGSGTGDGTGSASGTGDGTGSASGTGTGAASYAHQCEGTTILASAVWRAAEEVGRQRAANDCAADANALCELCQEVLSDALTDYTNTNYNMVAMCASVSETACDFSMETSMGCGNLTCASSKAFMDENMAMHTAMAIHYECNVEVDFLRGMIPHHLGAVKMCEVLREHTTRPDDTDLDELCLELCASIDANQTAEIAMMRSWLTSRHYAEEAPCSTTTAEDDHMDGMAGMKSMDGMDGMDHGMTMGCGNLTCASSAAFMAENMAMHEDMAISFECNAEVDFLRGMIPHHQGAVEMCKVLRDHSTTLSSDLDDLCNNIEEGQSTEIAMMKNWLGDWGAEAQCSTPTGG